MQPLSAHGAPPSVSNRLATLLQTNIDESAIVQEDEFDRLIRAEGLRIARFTYFRDLDILLLILTNRRIISRRLSDYPFLFAANDQQLTEYTVSASGIHWPLLDADLSLRGFLIEDAVKSIKIAVDIA